MSPSDVRVRYFDTNGIKMSTVPPSSHRQRLETLLKELTPSREDIAAAMIFCLERADAAEEVVGHITDSFSSPQTPLQKKVSFPSSDLCRSFDDVIDFFAFALACY